MLYQTKEMFAGHIKVFGGPHVARGPDVAQACYRLYRHCKTDYLLFKIIRFIVFTTII